MRLFIAINFSNEFKNELTQDVEILREQCFSANYTRRENLHLTLVFIGEISSPARIKQALDVVEFTPFEIGFGSVGNFRDLYTRTIKDSGGLKMVQADVVSRLTEYGIAFDKKPFKPHVTLARRVEPISKIILPARDKKMTVEKISLMKSERINGRMVYTEIYSKKASGEGQ